MNAQRKHYRNLRAGFTLVELLAVVAIVSILATLAATGLSKARGTADLTVCKSNLRQIGLSLHLYLGDGGRFPLQSGPQPEGKWQWPDSLEPYTGTKWPTDWEDYADQDTYTPALDAVRPKVNLYVCPGYRGIRGLFLRPPVTYGVVGAYAYNARGLGGLGLGYVSKEYRDVSVSESMVVNPSAMMTFGDAALSMAPHDKDLRRYFLGEAFDLGFNNSYTQEMEPNQQGVAKRHSGRWMMFYVDGHVETLKTQELFDRRNPERLRRWNRDSLPHEELIPW